MRALHSAAYCITGNAEVSDAGCREGWAEEGIATSEGCDNIQAGKVRQCLKATGFNGRIEGTEGVVVFMSSGLCCLPKEYEARDGQCCPMCHEGSVVKRDCTPQYGTRCISCVNGTFMNKPNGLNKCFPCASCDQGHGLLTQQTCTATTDTLCDVVSGYFCKAPMEDTGTGCSLAQKHRQCGPGYRTLEPGTSETDTVCESCPPGFFSPDGVNCIVWTTCSESEVEEKAGSTSSDVVCVAASRQYFLYLAFILPLLTVGLLFIKGKQASKKPRRTSSAKSSDPSD